ncbi:hypothetical protein N9X80_01820 [Candidatus Pelagibacter bacterium]|nr:hypothetical protein [Candidatus Pelagibacter bacterium]
MKKLGSKIIDYQIKNDQNYTNNNKSFKTTNINILLNRVRLEKKNRSKKKLIFSISIISIVSFLSIIILGD